MSAIITVKRAEEVQDELMASSVYRDVPDGYVLSTVAAQQLGVNKRTLANMLRRLGMTVHHDPRDARVKLITVEDVERLRQPMREQKEEPKGI